MFEYTLPDVGEGVAEGEIVEWHVEVGDEVVEDQVLAEVETDKAVVDLPSPVDGVIAELHAEAGDIVAVGSVVVTIDTDGDGTATEDGDGTATEDGETDVTGTESTAEAAEPSQPAGDDGQQTGGRVFAPPNVRRLARELGVDITAVSGSGPSGRITEGDVRTAAESGTEQEEPAEIEGKRKSAVSRREPAETEGKRKSAVSRPEPAASETPADREKTLAAPATRNLATELGVDLNAVPTEKTRDGHAVVEPDDVRAYAEAQQETATQPAQPPETGVVGTEPQSSDPVRTEAYRGIRRTIGQRMSQSAFTAPHATHHDSAVVPGLVEARAALKPAAEKEGVKLTYMPFIMKAIATALPDYPPLNAELDAENEEIHYHQEYHIGVAVATDAGLMVPVVRNVERKGLLELAAEVNDLVSRARTRELTPEELQGSTFTITNFGAIGGEYATPILNHPETGILGLGELKKRPVVEDDAVVARETLPLSLSIDHRVVDGADAAAFCNELKTYLETPTKLLL